MLKFCNDRGVITDVFGIKIKRVGKGGGLGVEVKEGPGGEGGKNAVYSGGGVGGGVVVGGGGLFDFSEGFEEVFPVAL